MPAEASRTVSYRKIVAETYDAGTNTWKKVDGAEWYVGVIDKITFLDNQDAASGGWQEFQYAYDNTKNNTVRSSRSVTIYPGGDKKSAVRLRIERAVKVDVIDTQSNGGDEAIWNYANSDVDTMPHHLKTHEFKIYGRNSDGTLNKNTWITMQRIDQGFFADPQDNAGQETQFTLNWPDDENSLSLSAIKAKLDISSDGSSINPPWRVDPFQTVVDFQSDILSLLVFYSTNKIAVVTVDKSFTVRRIFQKNLASSSWGSDYIKTNQQRGAANGPMAVFTALKIVGNTISKGDTYSATYITSGVDSLAARASSTLAWRIDRGLSGYWINEPHMAVNGTGLMTTPWESFQINATLGTITLAYSASVTDNQPVMIDAAGLRVYLPTGWGVSSSQPQLSGTLADFGPLFTTNFPAYVDATIPFVYYATTSGPGGVSEHAVSGFSGPLPMAVYTKSGGYDRVQMHLETFNYVAVAGGTWGVYSVSGGTMYPYYFPPGLSADKIYMHTLTGASTHVIQTPYETLPTITSIGFSQILSGWLHLSNGKNFLQGYFLSTPVGVPTTDPKIYVDGHDIGAAIATAIGAPVTSIQSIMMDVPLARVTQFT